MSDSPVAINLEYETIDKFNRNMQDLYYTTRPEYEECLLRCKILNLINDIWQKYLYQNELDSMHDEYNNRYRDIITNKTYVEMESIPNPQHYNKPYKRYGPPSTTKSKSKLKLKLKLKSSPNADSNSNDDTAASFISVNNDNNESENDKSMASKDDIFSGSEEKIRESASSAASSSDSKSINDNDNVRNKDDDESFNHWCTPIEGEKKVIIIREYENGPIIKRVIIPSVMIFGVLRLV